eukprot:9198526-Lingulodinium_polyedra.AAC.1
MSADRRRSVVSRSTFSWSERRRPGTPSSWSLVRRTGGPGRRKRARLHVRHNTPEWTIWKIPARTALRMSP